MDDRQPINHLNESDIEVEFIALFSSILRLTSQCHAGKIFEG
jgi:hypothetical protein